MRLYWQILLPLLLPLTPTAAAATLTDYLNNTWQQLRAKLAAPAMRLFYHPDQVEAAPPDHLADNHMQDIFFHTADGVRLHGRLYTSAATARGTIVQFHGNAGNLTHHVTALAWLVEHGYNLFSFDYRGYGRSQATPSPAGLYQDALAALQETERLHRTYASTGLLLVIGQSLGGAVALKALQDFTATLPLDLLVLDSTFASYRNVAIRSTAASFPGILLTPLAWLLVSDAYAADLQRNRHRLLILHARHDQVVPFHCGERIYKQATSTHKDFWPHDSNTHILLTPALPPLQQRFLRYLDELYQQRHLQPSSRPEN